MDRRAIHFSVGLIICTLIASVTWQEPVREETLQEGSKYIQKQIFDGWHAQQRIEVTSTDVPRIERLAREATQLLEKGIAITSESPRYHYTKVSDLKIEMLAEASRDARLHAERMLEAAGGGATVGRVEGISTGVININAANSTDTSWEGNYDTSSFEKDIITTVRVVFEVNNQAYVPRVRCPPVLRAGTSHRCASRTCTR